LHIASSNNDRHNSSVCEEELRGGEGVSSTLISKEHIPQKKRASKSEKMP